MSGGTRRRPEGAKVLSYDTVGQSHVSRGVGAWGLGGILA